MREIIIEGSERICKIDPVYSSLHSDSYSITSLDRIIEGQQLVLFKLDRVLYLRTISPTFWATSAKYTPASYLKVIPSD